MLAFFNLQVILGLDPPITIALADVQNAANLVQTNKAKLALYEDANEYYVLLSIIRMLDVMVGNEPFLDFKPKKHQYIQIIEDYLEKVSGIILLNRKFSVATEWWAENYSKKKLCQYPFKIHSYYAQWVPGWALELNLS